jgi:hypothetical protein
MLHLARLPNCKFSSRTARQGLHLLGLGQDLDVPVRSIDADPLSISDQPSGLLDAHHGRRAVLARDDCAMGH